MHDWKPGDVGDLIIALAFAIVVVYVAIKTA